MQDQETPERTSLQRKVVLLVSSAAGAVLACGACLYWGSDASQFTGAVILLMLLGFVIGVIINCNPSIGSYTRKDGRYRWYVFVWSGVIGLLIAVGIGMCGLGELNQQIGCVLICEGCAMMAAHGIICA